MSIIGPFILRPFAPPCADWHPSPCRWFLSKQPTYQHDSIGLTLLAIWKRRNMYSSRCLGRPHNILALLLISSFITSCLALWPQPTYSELGSSTLWLSPQVKLAYDLRSEPRSAITRLWSGAQQWFFSTSQRSTLPPRDHYDELLYLEPAFKRTKYDIFNRSFVPEKFHPREALFEPVLSERKRVITEVVVQQTLQDSMSGTQRSQESEAYELEISSPGKVLIKISSFRGALHAFETFRQLFFAHSSSSLPYTSYAPLHIRDKPIFQHRGLNLDISRNWISPKDVRRTVEAMAANKLNRLHIHASDSQSWPIEVPARPELALKGAYSPSKIWTVADLEEVQRHGASYGMEVFLEIDLPGHTGSVGNAFPDLVTAKDAHPWPDYALEPPSGQLRLNSSEVSTFLEDVLHDVLSRTSKYSSLFHLGGDEVNMNAYLLDPTVRSSSYDTLRPLVQTLINQVVSIAKSHSLTIALWEEMILDWKLDVPQENVVVQTWRDSKDKALDLILAEGYRTLVGSNAYWYLDCGHGAFVDPEPSNPDSPVKPPYLDYCNPYNNWRHVYAHDPVADVRPDQRYLVLGGEAHLWGELTDSVNLDSMLWPRLAAAAEVMWSSPSKRPSEDTTRRLAEMRERLVARGVGAGPVQMEWCLKHKGGCTQ